MKTKIYKFIIELPDGNEITSDEYEYEYCDNKQEEEDLYKDGIIAITYDDVSEEIENDKIAWVFNTLSIRHEEIK